MEYSAFLYILTGKYIERVVIVLIIIIITFTCTSLNTQVDRDVKFEKFCTSIAERGSGTMNAKYTKARLPLFVMLICPVFRHAGERCYFFDQNNSYITGTAATNNSLL